MENTTLSNDRRATSRPRLLAHHRDALRASGIPDTVIHRRGYWSAQHPSDLAALGFADYQRRTPALVIPFHNVTGEQEGHQIRPDTLRRDAKGRIVKYETPAGSKPIVDCPPAALPALCDPNRPLCITEGAKKADAATAAGLATVSLQGVWGWLRDGEVMGDLRVIALRNRRVLVAYDSDVMTKPSVRQALRELTDVLQRRGAKVAWVMLPDLDGIEKTGLDDFLAAGHTKDDVLALAVAPHQAPEPDDVPDDADAADQIASLRRKLAAKDAVIGAQGRLLLHADFTPTEQAVIYCLACLCQHRHERGDATLFEEREIANDYRAAPKKGERLATTNPDGTRPLLSYERVKPTLRTLTARGIITASPHQVDVTALDRPRDGRPRQWKAAAWHIAYDGSFAAFLDRAAAWQPDHVKERKRRTPSLPCVHCGEIHPIAREDRCGGCGAVRHRETIEPVRDDAASEPGSDKLSDNESWGEGRENFPPSRSPHDVLSDNLSEHPPTPHNGHTRRNPKLDDMLRRFTRVPDDASPPEPPSWLDHAPPPDEPPPDDDTLPPPPDDDPPPDAPPSPSLPPDAVPSHERCYACRQPRDPNDHTCRVCHPDPRRPVAIGGTA